MTALASPSPQELWAQVLAHLREAQRLRQVQQKPGVSWQEAGQARSRMINESVALAAVLSEMDALGLLDALPDYLDVVYR